MSVTYLVVPLNTYQHQDVYVGGDAEKEEVKEKLTHRMWQTWSVDENDRTNRQAEQAEYIRHCQAEKESLRDRGAVQMSTEFYDHRDVGRDTKQETDCNNHASSHVPGPEAGGQRWSWVGAVLREGGRGVGAAVNSHHGGGMMEEDDEEVMRLRWSKLERLSSFRLHALVTVTVTATYWFYKPSV